MQQNKKLILVVIFAILGIVISLQVKGIIYVNKKMESQSIDDIERLTKEIQKEQQIGKELTKKVLENERIKEENLKNSIALGKDNNLKKLKEELDVIKFKSGLVPVKGEGVIVSLDDAEARINEDESTLILHDRDIVRVVNELKKAGAQAISINDERVTGVTECICAGPTIMINGRKYTTPFEIKAIGDPNALYDTVNSSKIVFYLIRDKIRVNISKSNDITIPKYDNANIDSLFSGLEVIDDEIW
ncbi:MAG TPA: DUF881 domain-containing protein [Pseudobacteroides sp.]|uniref:DUF881 domain-containing protein n=1 Tax=Pseudobacteroides sp. TaxID=1968840 RepID=UPI002F92BCD3